MSSRPARNASLAAVATFAALAAGCGGSHATPQSASTQSLAAGWHRVVLCARAHGMPGLQDPRIDPTSGKPIFPSGLKITPDARRACQSMADRLEAIADNRAPTAAQLAGLLRFARCMRSHGVYDFPDPRPDGTFVPDTRLLHALKTTVLAPLRACEHFNPDPHGTVNFSHP
jgi:hypothetical protein